jgi:hopanoid biosynthesis associated RND transporter like protein HpnN
LSGVKKGPLGRILTALSGHCFKHPRSSLAICLIFFVAGIFLAATRLTLEMDWTFLFERDDPVVEAVEHGRELFPIPGDIAVLVDQGTPQQREEFLEKLAQRLAQEPKVFYQVFYRVDLEPLGPKALYYLDDKTLNELAKGLRSMSQGTATSTSTPTGGAAKKIILKLLQDLDQSLETRGRAEYEPVWEFLTKEQQGESVKYLKRLLNGERYIYPTIGNGQVNVLLFHTGPWGNAKAPKGKAVTRTREIIEDMTPTVKDIRIRLTGLPVMLNDERETCTQDSIRSGVISIVLIVIIFAIGFGEFSRPVFAVTALSCGLGWTMGYTTLVVGHLNFITVSLVTMLMGLGIDFGIHLLFRYDEELGKGRTPEQAMDVTIAGTGVDTLVGATATAAAFLALTQANFRGISDFGIIASGGVLLCLLSTVTVLPSLLALYPGRARPPAPPDGFLAWLEGHLLGNARRLSVAGVFFLAICAAWATQVGFSYNLLKIQAKEIESVRTEIEMVSQMKRSVLSGQVLVKGEEAARRKSALLNELPAVSNVGSILAMIPVVEPERQALIEEVVSMLPQLHLPEKVRLEDAADLLALQKRVNELDKQTPDSVARDPDVDRALENVKRNVTQMDPGPVQDGLTDFQDKVRTDLGNVLDLLKKQTATPPNLEDLPPFLVMRYVSPDGYYKLKVSAERNIWEKENLELFLAQVQAVEPELLGHPVVQEHILAAFNRAFHRTPWFTLIGVLIVMMAYMRSFRATLLSLLPTATGVLVIFAAMGFVGLDFNVVNFVALPMSVGIGAVYGVHALHRMRELKDETILTSSTGPALLLSGVTTMVGFASLMTAHHRGLSSLGFVISVGVAVNFGGSLIFLPAMRRALKQKDRAELEDEMIARSYGD